MLEAFLIWLLDLLVTQLHYYKMSILGILLLPLTDRKKDTFSFQEPITNETTAIRCQSKTSHNYRYTTNLSLSPCALRGWWNPSAQILLMGSRAVAPISKSRVVDKRLVFKISSLIIHKQIFIKRYKIIELSAKDGAAWRIHTQKQWRRVWWQQNTKHVIKAIISIKKPSCS